MDEKKKIVKEIFERFTDKAFPSKELAEKSLLSQKLVIYLGVDPTGEHLHLGHATNLLVLKKLQELGHKIIFLIGDFTAMIGDPTDRLSPRQPLTKQEVQKNLKTFKKQAEKIISFSGENPTSLRFNSEWHAKMKFEDVIKIAEHITVPQMLARDMFQERLKTGGTVSLNEFLYPLMQGYDSVALDVDMEIGGTDQTFNMLVGRDLQKIYHHKEKFVLTTKLLVNQKTGKKLMNKSEGGLINLDDAPNDMFGKVMALPDEAIQSIAELSTDMPIEKARSLTQMHENPRDAKLELAFEIVKLYHSPDDAKKAQEEWLRVFSKKETPTDIKKIKVKKIILLDLLRLAGIKSKSEARRLVQQKAVRINGIIKEDPNEILELKNGDVLKFGNHSFLEIIN